MHRRFPPKSETMLVTNPYRHQPPAINKTAKSCHEDSVLTLEMSDNSLEYSHDDDEELSCSSVSSSWGDSTALHYAVKTLTLLLIGFAGGLLYHLVATNPTSARALFSNQIIEMPEGQLMTDELVKKLATESQFAEKEILKLQQQVRVQAQQVKMVTHMESRGMLLAQQDPVEEPQQRQQNTEQLHTTQDTVQQKPQEVHPQNEDIVLGRFNAETGVFELYDHEEHVYKPVAKKGGLRKGRDTVQSKSRSL